MASEAVEDLIGVLEMLSRAYPERHPNADTLDEYLQHLGDIPIFLVERAAREHIRESPWFPKISELYQRCTKLAGSSIYRVNGGFDFLEQSTRATPRDDPLLRRMLTLEDEFTETGRLDAEEWKRLAAEFRHADRPHRAARLLERLQVRTSANKKGQPA